jgi:hypothetical protein
MTVGLIKWTESYSDGVSSIEMISFLSDWIHDHVPGTNQELGPFLASQGDKLGLT